jgi:regulatory protein
MSSSKTSSADELSDPYSFAQSIALHALAPRAKSRAELAAHLAKRGVAAETAAAVLDDLELSGFINDLDFARAWSSSRQRQKKLSRRVIASELRIKGVSQDIIDEISADISDDHEFAQALALAERKFRSISHLEHRQVYQRIASLLARKGYGHAMASRVVRHLMSDSATFEGSDSLE